MQNKCIFCNDIAVPWGSDFRPTVGSVPMCGFHQDMAIDSVAEKVYTVDSERKLAIWQEAHDAVVGAAAKAIEAFKKQYKITPSMWQRIALDGETDHTLPSRQVEAIEFCSSMLSELELSFNYEQKPMLDLVCYKITPESFDNYLAKRVKAYALRHQRGESMARCEGEQKGERCGNYAKIEGLCVTCSKSQAKQLSDDSFDFAVAKFVLELKGGKK